MRSLAREIVFQYVFSRLFNQGDEGLFDVLAKDLSKDDKSFAEQLLDAITANETRFDEELKNLSENFKSERIHVSDRCAIYIGMAELDCFKDVPTAVAIDEAVKLSAKFSTEKSPDYVNGILAEYAKKR